MDLNHFLVQLTAQVVSLEALLLDPETLSDGALDATLLDAKLTLEETNTLISASQGHENLLITSEDRHLALLVSARMLRAMSAMQRIRASRFIAERALKFAQAG